MLLMLFREGVLHLVEVSLCTQGGEETHRQGLRARGASQAFRDVEYFIDHQLEGGVGGEVGKGSRWCYTLLWRRQCVER